MTKGHLITKIKHQNSDYRKNDPSVCNTEQAIALRIKHSRKTSGTPVNTNSNSITPKTNRKRLFKGPVFEKENNLNN